MTRTHAAVQCFFENWLKFIVLLNYPPTCIKRYLDTEQGIIKVQGSTFFMYYQEIAGWPHKTYEITSC